MTLLSHLLYYYCLIGMEKIIASSALVLLFCINILSQVNLQKEIESVKQADIDFSNLSKEKGMKEAFLQYAASDAALLRPYMRPVTGYDAVKNLIEQDKGEFTLTWAPLFGDVAASGELGYTYGTYELTFKNEKGEIETRKGTYATVWKKNEKGEWKWVLDTGNPGLEPKK